MPRYQCEWCGRFYASPLPEPSSCPNHIPEWNAKLTRQIDDFNRRLATRDEPCGVVGEPEAGLKVCELPKGHDGYHRQGRVRWLGYHPKSDARDEPSGQER